MMRRMKQLLPLWVLLAILLVAGGVVFGLDRVQAAIQQSEACAVLVPSADGVWELYPNREPELVYAWKSKEHFVISDNGHSLIFDGTDIWFYMASTRQLTLFAEEQRIDHTLGAAGIALPYIGNCRPRCVLYLDSNALRMEAVDWCDQLVTMCTATLIDCTGNCVTLDLPVALQSNWGLAISVDSSEVYSIAQREDGLLRAAATTVKYNSNRPRGWWFEATPQQKIEVDASGYDIRTVSDEAITVLSVPFPARFTPEERTTVYSLTNAFAFRFPHRFADRYDINDCYFLTPTGSLYCRDHAKSTCIDRFSDIDEAAFASAQISDGYFILPTGTGTRVYAEFSGYGWKRFDLPAEMD